MEATDDHFALKWNNFHSNFASSFHNLLQAEDLVDVTIAAEGKFIQAHKIILSVCSPYFKELFKVNPCKHPVVFLKDVRHQELSDVLDFMYRGEANVRQDDLPSFLKLAESLKVKGLANERDEVIAQTHALDSRKPLANVKKKKVIEQTVFEDEVIPEFTTIPGEPKRKRRRAQSPQYRTESATEETTNVLQSPKREIELVDEVEFLEDTQGDPLEDYMIKNKHQASAEFEESNLELTGDEGNDEGEEMTGSFAGPSGIDDTTDQVPPEVLGVSYHYIANHHGLPQLVHDGYVYRRDRERLRKSMNIRGESVSRVRTYWRCVIRTCRARSNIDPVGELRLTHAHNHPRNEDSVKYRNLRTEIKKRALERKRDSPREILAHFKINDACLEKTIVNWRYRYIRDSRGELAIRPIIRKREDNSESLFVQDGQNIYVQEGNLVLNAAYLEEDDDGEGNSMYYIIDDEK